MSAPLTVPAPAGSRPARRPFVPQVPAPPVARLTSLGAKLGLVGTLALAYVLQFGLAVLTAVIIFVIRQDGDLEVQATGSAEYLLTLSFFGVVPVGLSLAVVAIYRWRARWSWAELGVRTFRGGPWERRLWWRTTAAYTGALIASGLIMVALSGLRGSGDYPTTDGGEVGRILGIVPQSVLAGVGEELLLVAFLVVAMERLGAPAPVIYVVAVTLRIAFHLYYGPAVLGLVLWAIVAVWLFRRTRLIIPLMVVHTLWDVNALSGEFVPVLAGLAWFAAIIAVIVTFIVHLASRRTPDPAGAYDYATPGSVAPTIVAPAISATRPPSLPPPGWYPWAPDAWTPPVLRYWSGSAWTEHTAPRA